MSIQRKAFNAHGITRGVMSDTIFEGQFENDLENGLCRVIWLGESKCQNDECFDGTLCKSPLRDFNSYFGWMKDGKKHGYGKHVQYGTKNDDTIQDGFFENDTFCPDGNV